MDADNILWFQSYRLTVYHVNNYSSVEYGKAESFVDDGFHWIFP